MILIEVLILTYITGLLLGAFGAYFLKTVKKKNRNYIMVKRIVDREAYSISVKKQNQ